MLPVRAPQAAKPKARFGKGTLAEPAPADPATPLEVCITCRAAHSGVLDTW